MPDATTEVLRAFGIRRGEPRPLGGGLSNAVWKVEGADGAYVLRRHDSERQPPAHVASELAWLDALAADAEVPAPTPVRRVDGELAPVAEAGPFGRPAALWTLLRWVDGETLGRLPGEHEAGLIGAVLAALHRRAKGWSPPPGFARPAYDAAHFAAAARGLLDRVGALLDPPTLADVDAALGRGTAVLDELGRDDAQVGLIHADIHDGNLVYGGTPKRVGVIDFERVGFGCWALDLAMALHYLPGGLHAPLVAAYAARAELTPAAREALPELRFLAAIENLAVLSAIPAEAEFLPAELSLLAAQAGRLAR